VRIDVFFGIAGLTASDSAGRVVIVIDVLRASTSIATALANGARTVIPLESTDEVVMRAKAFDRSEVKLARAPDATHCRLRSRQFTSRIHAGGSRREDRSLDDDERNGRDRFPPGPTA
jgi:hypothetical protein